MTKPSDSTVNEGQTDNDSSTVVNFALGGPRKSVGFKCNKKLWDAFVSYSKAEYGSVCHLLEPIIYAILTARVNLSKTMKADQSIVIENFNVERVVQRHRRIYREEQGERRANYFSDGHWLHFDGEVNDYGHIVGCKCHWCTPLKPRRGQLHHER